MDEKCRAMLERLPEIAGELMKMDLPKLVRSLRGKLARFDDPEDKALLSAGLNLTVAAMNFQRAARVSVAMIAEPMIGAGAED